MNNKSINNTAKSMNNKAMNNKAMNNKSMNNKAMNNKAMNNKAMNNKSMNNKAMNNKSMNNKSMNNKSMNNKSMNNTTKSMNNTTKSMNNKAMNNKSMNNKSMNNTTKSMNNKAMNNTTKSMNNKAMNNTTKSMNNTTKSMNNKAANEVTNYSKFIKYGKYAVGIIVLIVIIYFIYLFITKKVLRIGADEINIEKQIYTTKHEVQYSDFTLPKNGYDYSMSFWIYINSYEYNIGLWKHIFHKGNQYDDTKMNYKTWNDLESQINKQSPGVWLHPSSNKIRIAFSTNIKNLPCNKILTQNACDGACTMCKWDEHLEQCRKLKEHPTDLERELHHQCNPNNNHGSINMEYVDINIPLRKMTHVAFVLENKILNIYYNGILKKIHKFIGEPIFHKNENMFFNLPETFEGTLFNFKYIPYEIKSDKVRQIHKNIPFTTKFTKKYRFDNYIKRFKLIDAAKSIVI